LLGATVSAAQYDMVLQGGRVIDPETARDGLYSVDIADGRIAAISEQPLNGAETLDVSGLVVAPGFIDLHTHSPTPLGFRYQARDLVTALEKMTLLPARRLETVAPVFRRKGRLQEGADADITVFGPDAIIDRATYR
jgi:dihydroorotase-like cyclic amidohydrolase